MSQEDTASPGRDDQAPRGAQAIERALGILLTFTANTPTLSLKDICTRTGLNTSTAHRMLKALQKTGFVVQHAADGNYSPGPAVVALSRVVLGAMNPNMITAVCRPHLDRLRDETGETVGLHIPSGSGRVCVAEAESRHLMRMSTGVATAFPWHAGAASKALLSAMPEADREVALNHSDWRDVAGGTGPDRELFLKQVEQAAQDGFATSTGETVAGASAIAVPIRGVGRQPVAAINITGPAVRWTHDRMITALPALQRAVEEIEKELGAGQPDMAGATS